MSAKNRIKVAISLLWYVGESLGRLAARLTGRRAEGRLVVLYYHAVPSNERLGFARQMDVLARKSRIVRAAHTGPLPQGEHCVAITFDDAFRSVAEHALPTLVDRSLCSTIFVPVGALGRPPGWETEGNGAERADTVMTVEELRSLPDLVELGSHSRTHPHLTRLDDVRLRDEIGGSRRELSEIVGTPVTLFAFPYGEHDVRAVEACREAGYQRVFDIVPRRADPLGSDFVRGRVRVDPSDGRLEFYLKMRGAYAWMPRASALKRALARRRGQP
jgi:peptidoglycan/xylan/chitin deacetylase (PgdA/CDA1 family)